MAINLEAWAGIKRISWVPVLKKDIRLGSHYKVVPTEGYLAWEYNPLRNYRLSENMYEKDGKYYTPAEFLQMNEEYKFYVWDDELKKNVINKEIPNNWTLHEAGELVDFITDELSFNIQNPVEILPQYSYDGSVNLILNDGLNIPRLINSRFTVTGRNTYKIIDRKGDNDTNIYDQGEQFDVDTSLFKNVNKIPKLEYLGTSSGNMKIGNYHFYFKLADADGNESDWVAESGLVSIFIGNTPQSVNTGIRDENSIKSVRFLLSNVDIGYSYVKIYYTRYSSDIDSNFVVQAKRIDKNFIVSNSGTCSILITGDEDETEVTLEEINSSFDVIQNAQTQCSAANRLFMANIHKSKVEYDILSKLSLCFCPYKSEENYPLVNGGMNETYDISSVSDGYYDTQYIYDKTGYWPGELYRLGIVYILKDGSLSPVFNIRGATNISTKPVIVGELDLDLHHTAYNYRVDKMFNTWEGTPGFYERKYTLDDILQDIDYSEEDYMIIGGQADNENAKGVIQLSQEFCTTENPFPVVGINITAHEEVLQRIKDYAKGFFFVRQKRIPLTLCQGIVVGLDNESRTPTLPTLSGVLNNINTHNSFVETSDLNDINYVSEGFLSRYTYNLKAKSSGFFSKLLKAVGVVAVLAAAVVATVFTCGVGGVAIGAGLTAAFTAGAGTVLGAIGTIGIVAGTTLGVAATAISAQTVALKARQKRNKKAAQAIKGRNEEIPKGYTREEQPESRLITHDLSERYIIKDPSKNSPDAIIVPDYQVNQPYYNQFLTGDKFTVKLTYEQPVTNFLNDGYFDSDYRHFYTGGYALQNDNRQYNVKLVGVPDGCPIKMIGDSKYSARAGYAEEAYKYEFQGKEYKDSENKRDNSDIVRGNYGSFVGMDGYTGHAGDQINIMIPGYKENQLFNYVQLRAQDTSAFYAISNRFDINELCKPKQVMLKEAQEPTIDPFSHIIYRGDSYICQFTHRINRNFNDPSAPYNDKIVDEKTWKDHYDPDKPEQYADINLGDVNAVQMGLWLTFWLRSSYNLNIRTIDKSNVDEYLMCGNYRSFYPNYGQLASGGQKIPDSAQYNKGFTKSVSEKYYFEVPDVPYIKQEFQNRIVFSDIHINDAYKNGFRVIRTMNHKDYPMTHGSITKLIELKNALLIVFEHGIGLVSINNSAEHPSQILSDLNIISDTYGSQWKDSIIKTPSGIYGVDTVAKKIWRVKEGQIELISDMRVQEFLNQNITLTERELTPVLGVRNVKTVYNAFKHDVMFTFYDNLNGVHEKSWNLCWNEILGIFTTFYSWIPSEMQNIDNIPFSFNRDVVKMIGKIGTSHHGNDYADGVTLSNNVMTITRHLTPEELGTGIHGIMRPTFTVANKDLNLTYINKQGEPQNYEFLETIPDEEDYEGTTTKDSILTDDQFIGFLHLDKRALPESQARYYIDYELMKDPQGNYKIFNIQKAKLAVDRTNEIIKSNVTYVEVCYLCLNTGYYTSDLLSEIYYRNSAGNAYADSEVNKIAPTPIKTSFTDIKIPGTQIKNKQILQQLLDKYGEEWPIGNDISYNKDTAHYCGCLGDININAMQAAPEGQEESFTDTTTTLHGIYVSQHWLLEASNDTLIHTSLPIFKNKAGKRLMLPKELQVNPDKIVRYLNIKAKVFIDPVGPALNAHEAYFNQFANGGEDVCLIDAGYFESSVAVTTSHNLSLLSTDFWKHGQAGLIDICDKIFPTYWYGQQHPFEFECVVVDDPSVHKIFTNLELVANKVKPESFHYEIVGDVYDFAEDKPTMYFRQEALKALYQYNGYDIEYNPNFLEIEPKQHNRSADLPKYYSRWDTVNDIYDSYKRFSAPLGFNYDHLAGAEIVYYPTRNEFRVWNHVEAIDVDSLNQDIATSVIKANCRYLEDKWLVSINPIIVTYKNEIDKSKVQSGESMFSRDAFGVYKYSTWVNAYKTLSTDADVKLPPINIQGTKLEEKLKGSIEFPSPSEKSLNALAGVYDLTAWKQGQWKPIDPTKNKDRRETDVRGKFMKVRIRYSGEELAIIDFLNTIYQISFA